MPLIRSVEAHLMCKIFLWRQQFYDDKVNHKTGSDSSVAKLQEYFGQSADIELEHHYKLSLAPAE